MANRHIAVTLEHNVNQRYVKIGHGAGRRAAVVYGRFSLRFRQNGKRIRVPLLDAQNLEQALKQRKEKEELLNAVPVAEKQTKRMLQKAVTTYLSEIKATKKPKTHSAYSTALRYFIECRGDKPLTDIGRHDMLVYRTFLKEEKSQSPRSEWNKFSNVLGFLNSVKVDTQVTKYDWPSYTETVPEIYSEDELTVFFNSCVDDERLIFEFFLKTGMREQEVMHCTDASLDFKNNTVSVKANSEYDWTPKAYKERTIPVPQSLMRDLKNMLVKRGKGGLLFPTREDGLEFHFLEMCKTVAKRESNPDNYWLHKFRATYATRALWSGVDLRTVQAWMGHSDLASTMRYLRPQNNAAMREKVEAIWA